MPLKGLTKAMWKEHMRKYIAFYLIGIVVTCVFANLIFTTTRYIVPDEREVRIYLTGEYSDPSVLDSLAADALAYGQSIDPTLEEVNFQSLQYLDPETDYTSAYLLTVRMIAAECDIYICSDLAFTALCGSDICADVTDIGEACGLEVFELINEEDGTSINAGVKLDTITSLNDSGAFYSENSYMVLANNTINQETSREVAKYILGRLQAGDFYEKAEAAEAPAETETSEEPAGTEQPAEAAEVSDEPETAEAQ